MSRLGLISDTHGYLDPLVLTLLKGADRILHAGDIGSRKILEALDRIAPVTAVRGNTDTEPDIPETEVVCVGEWRILIQHIVDPGHPLPDLARRLARVQPHAVVFGHTHHTYCQRHCGTLFVNPGYAGRPRQGQKRHLAILECTNETLSACFLPMDQSTNG